ncbi:zinc transporter ZntB [Cognatishimia sp. SS12]|uniref:zinc transporter ZntB n=1 Tax=Cognatishimia sp. SS12 TaxID=2979465 RepID=UPI00232E91AD|nr:zinc transporter ZntB [Cognatishimia sp. SS12]MDC0739411.1 zinc transporter ZntB [Cognatishimia sp. SS12]
MIATQIMPIAAYDISDIGSKAVSAAWPQPVPEAGHRYRWLHFDVADAAMRSWAYQHLPDIAAGALVQPETRPRCERHDAGLILNLRGVNLNPQSSPEDMVSLRMWVTEGAVVSARVRKVFAMDALREAAEGGTAPQTVGQFLVALVHGLTNRIETVVLDLEEKTDALDDRVLEGASATGADLTGLRQTVIKLRRFLNPQREAITAMAGLRDWILSPDELAELGEASNRTRRIVEQLDALRERLMSLQDHVDAERAQAMSRNSYILSIMAAIFLPLGFLTGLFGANVAGMPGTATPAAFWILAFGSVATGLLLFLIFRWTKLL